ncbi:MAG: RNA 2',3'-cyclic phosphodiesterase [Candidatus Uhrbacteria bacterium]|nr:RNA 2',3'-cyclic phosphodiesterase [Candidatus Uhrbacteria bacterium]
MKRRIFVAIPISDELQQEIERWEQSFQKFPARWLLGKNLHITLVPPWYEEDIDGVIKKLSSIEMAHDRFVFDFFRVAYGPSVREPRLIWAEGETPSQLLALKENIERALNIEPEHRPFKLHLTLARFRPETFSLFPTKKLDEHVAWHQICDSFVLMESHLSRAGADYEIIKSFAL